ncbi:MAG: selenocysteine-specific translation elongation factor [Candidatus Aminicenantaceae bacterium]
MTSQDLDKTHVIVGTAGHIDHGKTALVKALTGIDADTLSEEKRRGITIELGFVFLDAPESAKQVVFIDVPGHEKLVKTMVAGASNIDAALLVVAADEGINVQTREHFEILQLLGIEKGIMALTKSDLVDTDSLAGLESALQGFVQGTFLEGAPVLPVSAVTGEGVADIKQALLDLADTVQERRDSGIFRMPVDRVFTMSGFGTVIAGTVLSGKVQTGERLEVYPEQMTSRVRGIQVHHSRVERSVMGRRTALNLPEIKKEDLKRGQVAAVPGSLVPTQRLDGRLHLLKSFGKELKNRTRVRLHVGTAEVICRIMLLEKDIAKPGEAALVQFLLEAPTVALPGDRFVIRSFSPVLTIGGGVILDSRPGKHKRLDPEVAAGIERLEGSLESRLEQMFLQSGYSPRGLAHMSLILGESKARIEEAAAALLEQGSLVLTAKSGGLGGREDLYLHRDSYSQLKESIQAEVKTYLEKNPYQTTLPLAELKTRLLKKTDANTFDLVLEDLKDKNQISVGQGRVGPAGYRVDLNPKDRGLADQIEQAFRRGDIKAPLESEVREQLAIPEKAFTDLMTVLLEEGRLVRLDDKVVYHTLTLHKVRSFVIEYVRRQGSITLAELRDALKFSRKYAQPILEYFDEQGLTRRQGDKRVLADTNGKA